jgi:hypothetical protein
MNLLPFVISFVRSDTVVLLVTFCCFSPDMKRLLASTKSAGRTMEKGGDRDWEGEKESERRKERERERERVMA